MAEKIGIRRVLVIVPGRAGFRIDPTHRVFVDEAMLRQVDGGGWRIAERFHFPFPLEKAGDVFVYNELHLRFEATDA